MSYFCAGIILRTKTNLYSVSEACIHTVRAGFTGPLTSVRKRKTKYEMIPGRQAPLHIETKNMRRHAAPTQTPNKNGLWKSRASENDRGLQVGIIKRNVTENIGCFADGNDEHSTEADLSAEETDFETGEPHGRDTGVSR
jgi:hypothetical protein